MLAKRIIGFVFLFGLIFSMAFKFLDGASSLQDNGFLLFFVLLTGILIAFGLRRILRS